MENEFLLSLCIPTYNRGKILDLSLGKIKEQFGKLSEPIELIVSDNCSTDDTQIVVKKYIEKGLPIRYIRNSENIGPDRNFVQCFQLAQGKYLWLLGDDDFLKEGALNEIIALLNRDTYGLVHLQIDSKNKNRFTEYSNPQKFSLEVGIWITFISSNIVNTNYVSKINFENYFASYLIQIPLYIVAVLSENKNLLIHERLLDDGVASNTNGGYNLFEVFVTNYLGIWKEQIKSKRLSRFSYEKIKYNLYRKFLVGYIFKLLIKKDNGSFKTTGAWKILFRTYSLYPYFYGGILGHGVRIIFNKLRR